MVYLASPISTMICARLGHRWTAVLGALMCVIALVSSSFVSSIYWLFLTIGILFGLGGNFCHVPGILIIQRYFKKRKALATGIFSTSSSFSSMLGPLYQFLFDSFGWRKTLWLSGLWFLFPLLLALVLYGPNVGDLDTNNADRRAGSTRRCNKIACSYWNAWFTIGVVGIALQSVALYTPLSHMVRPYI